MITQDYFLKKISELAHMRCLSITPAAAKHISGKFEEFEPPDLDKAIDAIMMETERFDFVRLLRKLAHSRADRLEAESNEHHIGEARAAKRFFDDSRYIGKCNRESCRGCPHIKKCEVRGKEWIKGINAIMRGNLGSEGAEQHIHYMTHEFMGGTG
jgi:hypothetical protein